MVSKYIQKYEEGNSGMQISMSSHTYCEELLDLQTALDPLKRF